MREPIHSPVSRVALYGYLGSGNIGNDASMETVLWWLRSVDRGVELSCITLCPEEIEARYGIPAVALSTYRERPGAGRARAVLRKIAGRLADVPRSWMLAGSADVVIVPGMGVLEDTLGVRPWGMPLWLFLLAAACRVRGRRFILLAVGADPAAHAVTRRLYAATVRMAHHVSYRDGWSAEAMRACGAREPDAVVPDLAFAHPSAPRQSVEPGRVVVGVMAYYGPHDDPVRGAQTRRRYVEVLATAVGRLVDEGDWVVLVGGDRVDLDVAHEIRAAALARCPDSPPGGVEVREVETFDELSEEMARAEVVVASRFHNLICALRLARPTVSLGYATKNRRLMSSMGLEEFCQDIQAVDADRLLEQVSGVRADALTLSASVDAATLGHAARVRELLGAVAAQDLGYPPAAAMRIA